jgi:hypothetical protein
MNQDKQIRTAPPPPPPETDDPQISESEISEWLELFGPEPETVPKQLPRPKPRPKAKSNKRKQPPRSLPELKRTDRNLDDDELSEWLDLFG